MTGAAHLYPGLRAAQTMQIAGELRTGQDLENAGLGFLTYLASLAPRDARDPVVMKSRAGMTEDIAFLRRMAGLLTVAANEWQQVERLSLERLSHPNPEREPSHV